MIRVGLVWITFGGILVDLVICENEGTVMIIAAYLPCSRRLSLAYGTRFSLFLPTITP